MLHPGRLAAIGLALLLLVLVTRSTQVYTVPSDSMLPTLVQNDRFIADQFLAPRRGPRRGELWVFKNPEIEDGNGPVLVKRVMGLPGEEVEIKQGYLMVNRQPQVEPYLLDGTPADNHPPVQLGAHEYFVLGDNRSHSKDSRKFGPILRDDLIGRAFFRSWPPTRARLF